MRKSILALTILALTSTLACKQSSESYDEQNSSVQSSSEIRAEAQLNWNEEGKKFTRYRVVEVKQNIRNTSNTDAYRLKVKEITAEGLQDELIIDITPENGSTKLEIKIPGFLGNSVKHTMAISQSGMAFVSTIDRTKNDSYNKYDLLLIPNDNKIVYTTSHLAN